LRELTGEAEGIARAGLVGRGLGEEGLLAPLEEIVARVRIPTESGHQLELKAATGSNGRRPLIPIDPGHPEKAGRSRRSDHR
jgi:hypothetical protein